MKLGNLALIGTLPFSFRAGKEQFGDPGGGLSSPGSQLPQSLPSFLDGNVGNGPDQDGEGGGSDLQTFESDYLALARDVLALIEQMGKQDAPSSSPGTLADSLMGPSSALDTTTSDPGINAAAPDDDPAPPAGLQETADAAAVPPSAGSTASLSAGSAATPSVDGTVPAADSAVSSATVDTGTGTGQSYHVHNDTDRDQYFLYSDSSGHKAVTEVKAGQVGTFTGGDNQPGIRIQTCGLNGETRSPANQALFEAGTQTTANDVVNNPDVSDVDGNLSYDGHGTDIEIQNNLGQKVGNLTGDAYRNWNDDTKTDTSNPMTMAQTRATQFDITFTDSNQTLATPGNR